jgi:hypothetical protein
MRLSASAPKLTGGSLARLLERYDIASRRRRHNGPEYFSFSFRYAGVNARHMVSTESCPLIKTSLFTSL